MIIANQNVPFLFSELAPMIGMNQEQFRNKLSEKLGFKTAQILDTLCALSAKSKYLPGAIHMGVKKFSSFIKSISISFSWISKRWRYLAAQNLIFYEGRPGEIPTIRPNIKAILELVIGKERVCKFWQTYALCDEVSIYKDKSTQLVDTRGCCASSEISELANYEPAAIQDFPRREELMTTTENPYEIPPPIQDHDVIKLNKTVFDEKFGKKQVTIEQLYDAYNKHFEGRVSVQGFRNWIAKEFSSNYKDKPSSRFAQPKLFAREEVPTQAELDERTVKAAPHIQALRNILGIFRK